MSPVGVLPEYKCVKDARLSNHKCRMRNPIGYHPIRQRVVVTQSSPDGVMNTANTRDRAIP